MKVIATDQSAVSDVCRCSREDEAIQSLPDPVSSMTLGRHRTKTTVMLLVVSFAWLVLTIPFALCGFIFAVGDIDVEQAALLMPFKAVAFLLMYTNHAVNFYLYCLTGSKFRRELIDTGTGCRRTVVGSCFRRSATSMNDTLTITPTNGVNSCRSSLPRLGQRDSRSSSLEMTVLSHRVYRLDGQRR